MSSTKLGQRQRGVREIQSLRSLRIMWVNFINIVITCLVEQGSESPPSTPINLLTERVPKSLSSMADLQYSSVGLCPQHLFGFYFSQLICDSVKEDLINASKFDLLSDVLYQMNAVGWGYHLEELNICIYIIPRYRGEPILRIGDAIFEQFDSFSTPSHTEVSRISSALLSLAQLQYPNYMVISEKCNQPRSGLIWLLIYYDCFCRLVQSNLTSYSPILTSWLPPRW